MSNEFDRVSSEKEHQAQRKPAEFQEAPGESEAEVMSRSFLQSAGSSPADVAGALGGADSGMRVSALSRLQQERGNAYVQRVVAEAKGTPGRLVGLGQTEMVDEVLQRKGGGQTLPTSTQAEMEGHFGADLSGVRVHADSEARALNNELDAQAFTVGSDIFFAEGKYSPTSSEGKGLLAHEITHVGQQGGFGGGSGAVQRQEMADEQVQRQAANPEEEEMPAGGQPEEAKKPEEEQAAA